MKKLLYAIVLMLVPFGLTAQALQNQATEAQAEKWMKMYQEIPAAQKTYFDLDKKSGGDVPLALNVTEINRVNSGAFSYFYDCTPIAYEPVSGAVVVLETDYFALEGDDVLTGRITIHMSTDNGDTWATRDVFDVRGDIVTNGAMGVMNPTGSSNPNDLFFIIYGRHFQYDGQGYPFEGIRLLFITPDSDPANPEKYDMETPFTGPSATEQQYTFATATDFSDDDLGITYIAGTLSPINDQVQYGAYGLLTLPIESDGAYDIQVASIPEEWSLNKFVLPDQKTVSSNAKIQLGTDENGNLYAIVNNFFVENPNYRVPGVSKSTDGGFSWEEFDQMPYTLIDQYIIDNGGIGYRDNPTPQPSLFPYNLKGFVVTGVDQLSFMYNILVWEEVEAGEYDATAHMIEAYYDEGVWGIRPITAWSGNSIWYVADVDETENIKDTILTMPRDHEIQAAMTADGQNLVFKWVDYNYDRFIQFNPPFQLPDFEPIDSMATTDIYVTYRGVNDEAWAEAINVTDDDKLDKNTWMPRVVPDLQNVPIIATQTMDYQMINPQSPRAQYPVFWQQKINAVPQSTFYGSMDVTTVSVEDVETGSEADMLLAAYPNPAVDNVEIPFKLEKGSHISIDIYDALGNKVMNVVNNYQAAGLHVVSVNTASLSSGVYYYTLTVNGERITKMLTVQK